MSSATPGPPSVVLLAGPQLLGFFLSWALQGVLSVQTYIYHLWFPDDNLGTKCLVYGIFIYEWIQTILVTQTAFEINVYNYGDRSSLTAFHNTWFSVTIMCALVSAVVQGYFCWRIYAVSRVQWLALGIGFFAFVQMCLGVSGGIMLHVIEPTAAEASAVTPVISSWLAGSAFVDVLIAVFMTFFLLQAKSGLSRADALINRLVRLVVESGCLTATVAIVDLVCFTAAPNTLLHECPALVLAKLYSNTLMVSLNNRAMLRTLTATAAGDESALSTATTTWQARAGDRRASVTPSEFGASASAEPPAYMRVEDGYGAGVGRDKAKDRDSKMTAVTDGERERDDAKDGFEMMPMDMLTAKV